MRKLAKLAMAAGLAFCGSAMAVQGPMQSPLKVTTLYTNNNSGTLYVAFQPGSMPGCYNNSGGYLYSSNSMYKELYAQLMTIVATGGVRAVVLYTQNTPTNNWGDCTIDGIYLLPE
jgi:hypothetical protein